MCPALLVAPAQRPAKSVCHGHVKVAGFTALFEALVLSLCQELPVRQTAALLRCADKQLWRRIEHYVSAARALDDMAGVRIVSIDETSLRKGQDYITVVYDLQAKRLLFACPGRDHQTVVDFAADLKTHGGKTEQIAHVCQAYAKGVGLALPQAQISYVNLPLFDMPLKRALELMPAVLAALIRMKDAPRCPMTPKPRHLQRIRHQTCFACAPACSNPPPGG